MTLVIDQAAPAACRRLETTEQDLSAIDQRDLAHMLALMHLIRAFEAQVLELKDEDLVHGPAHGYIGEEAVAAGVATALHRSDLITSTHRPHGHFLAKALLYYAPEGYDPLRDPLPPELQEVVYRTLAEIMGLRDGWCGGRGGSMHLCDPRSGNLGSNGIVGGGIPLATGIAWAQKLQKKDTIVVSFFGDGAINQGCFHEVANMAALWGLPVLYLVENNHYAVGTRTDESSYVPDLALRSLGYGFDSLIVDGMDPVSVYLAVRETAQNMRRQPFPFLIEAKTYRFCHHGGSLPGSAFGYRTKAEEAEWLARDPLTVFPKALARLGVVTAEDDERLRAMAQESVAQAVDACTETRQGQRHVRPDKWPAAASAIHHVRGEDAALAPEQFKEIEDFSEFRTMTYVEAIAAATLRSMERDERVVVLGEEVASLRGGAYGATRGIKEVFPARLINTPISETGFVGMAGGLAAAGMRPVVEIMYPDFALMASDQLFNQIGKLRHMYGGQVSFPLVLRTRIGIGFGYGGQHSLDPAALFALFSGWRIVAPSTPFDYVGLFNTAMRFDDPVLVIEHGKLYPEAGPVPAGGLDYYVKYGRARIARQGTGVTVLTYLTGVQKCLQAAEELAAEGISAEVIDLRTLDYTGLDFATIGESVRKTGSVVIVEEAPRSMGIGAHLGHEIQERFFDYLDGPIARVAALDVPLPVSRKLEEAVLPSLGQIKAQIGRGARRQF